MLQMGKRHFNKKSQKWAPVTSVKNMGGIWNILGEQTDLKNEKKTF